MLKTTVPLPKYMLQMHRLFRTLFPMVVNVDTTCLLLYITTIFSAHFFPNTPLLLSTHPPTTRALLEQGGSRGEGDPPCRNVPNALQIDKLLYNDLFGTWKCHVVVKKQRGIIIVGQLSVPSPITQQTQESGTLHMTTNS